MPTDRIHLIGAGGHASVVIDALLRAGRQREQISLWTEAKSPVATELAGFTIGQLDIEALRGEAFNVCIGNNEARRRLHLSLEGAGAIPTTVIHPDASLALDARIGAGSFIAARAILAPNSTIGISCIINHGAIVDHDCIIRDFAHIAPGATLGGNVHIGSDVLVGAGANLLPGISVAERSTIGAGAVVTTKVPVDTVFVGIPAKPIR